MTITRIILLVVALLVLTSAPSARASSCMYWVNDGSVYVGPRDGSQVNVLLDKAVTGDSIRVIDIDQVESKLYLYGSNSSFNFVKRCDLDGSDTETILDSGVPSIKYGFAIDSVNRKMYLGSHGAGPPDGMRWANLDGTGFEVIPPDPYYSHDIEVDLQNNMLYWTNSVDYNGIRRANLDGSGQQNVIGGGGDLSMHIALDVPNGQLYFSDSGDKRIGRMDLDGSNVQTILLGIAAEDIELDAASGKLYWASETKIQRANLDGSDVEDLVDLVYTGHNAGDSLVLYAAPVPVPAAVWLALPPLLWVIRRGLKRAATPHPPSPQSRPAWNQTYYQSDAGGVIEENGE